MFTVVHPNSGEAVRTGLTFEEAVIEVLSYDSGEFEIRLSDFLGYWNLWTRTECAGKPWSKTSINSFEIHRDDAELDIFRQVARARWPGYPEVWSDREYAKMVEEHN